MMTRQSSRRSCHGNALLRLLSKLPLLLLIIQLVPQYHVFPNNLQFGVVPVAADGLLTNLAYKLNDLLFPPEDYINAGVDLESKSLSIIEISDMRVRDIKRRLGREHGYGADELSRMLDKKELINALSYEEHKLYQQEVDKRKWRKIKSTIIYTCAAVLVVMFWPLLTHAFEVAHVNFVVYTDKRRHELSRCREYSSKKGYFGMFLLFIIDALSTWLSVSVLLSWVMRSKYFFPIPNIPIKPAQLLAGGMGGDAGALGQYGINVGPMIISGLFRFLNNRVEGMIGKAMSSAFQKQRKDARREERAKEKEERRRMKKEAKRQMKEEEERARQEAEERARVMQQNSTAAASNCETDDSDLGAGKFTSSPFDDLD